MRRRAMARAAEGWGSGVFWIGERDGAQRLGARASLGAAGQG
jgi:hypothetical protein